MVKVRQKKTVKRKSRTLCFYISPHGRGGCGGEEDGRGQMGERSKRATDIGPPQHPRIKRENQRRS